MQEESLQPPLRHRVQKTLVCLQHKVLLVEVAILQSLWCYLVFAIVEGRPSQDNSLASPGSHLRSDLVSGLRQALGPLLLTCKLQT